MAKGQELVPATDYAVIQMNADDLRETIKTNVGTQQLSEFDLDRVKVPSGGGTSWEVPTLEGDESMKSIQGVIVFKKDTRAFWKGSYEGGSEPPDCSSPDAERATGDPGVNVPADDHGLYLCERCPNAEFGSDPREGSNAQACKLVRQLFVLTPEDLLPIVISLPPTSYTASKNYFLRLARRGVPYHQVVTEIGLEKQQSGGGITYSRATFQLGSRLEGQQAQVIKDYADQMRPAFESASRTPDADDLAAA